MGKYPRRKFLKGAVAGATVAAAAAAAPGLLPGGLFTKPGDMTGATSPLPPSAPIVAYIKDASKGEIALMMGTEETLVTDPVLVSHLAAATQARA